MLALCALCLIVSGAFAQETSITIQASSACVSQNDSSILTVQVRPVTLLPTNGLITWKYKEPSGSEVTLPDKGMTIVVKDFVEAYRSYWFTFVDVNNILRTGCKAALICKCQVLAVNDLLIRLDQKRLLLKATSFYDKVLLKSSTDQILWNTGEDVTHKVWYDLSIVVSTYFRLDGYVNEQLMQSSPVVFLNKIQYHKPLSGVVTNFAGQTIKSFTNIQAYNDANLGLVVTKDLPNQTYVIILFKYDIRYAYVYTRME